MNVAPACRDPIILRDEMHYTMMERGSNRLSDAIRTHRAGFTPPVRNEVMWLTPRQPVGKPREYVPQVLDRQHRDPCPYCAVRGDIGCKHRRAA